MMSDVTSRDSIKLVSNSLGANLLLSAAAVDELSIRLSRLEAKMDEMNAMHLIADAGTELFQELLDSIDPHLEYEDWSEFRQDLVEERRLIWREQKIDAKQWVTNREKLVAYPLHKKVIDAVKELGLNLSSFQTFVEKKRDRNEATHTTLRARSGYSRLDKSDLMNKKIVDAEHKYYNYKKEGDDLAEVQAMGDVFRCLSRRGL